MAIFGRDSRGHFITRTAANERFEAELQLITRALQQTNPDIYEALNPIAPMSGRLFPTDLPRKETRKLNKNWHRTVVRKGRGQKWYMFKKGDATFTTPDNGLGVDAAAASIIASNQMGKYLKKGIRQGDLKQSSDFDSVYVFYARGNNEDDEDYDDE